MNMKGTHLQCVYLVLQMYVIAILGHYTTDFHTYPSPSIACGDGHCLCNHDSANCSYRDLTYIPRLNSNISHINLSHNKFRNLSVNSWENITVSNIVRLDISFCAVHKIESETFQQFRRIKTLILSDNPVQTTELAAAMTMPDFKRLEYLYLAHLNITDITFVSNMKARYLMYLNLDKNQLTVYNQYLFSKCKRLAVFSANYNRINKFIFCFSKSLRTLQLDVNNISNFPSFCRDKKPYFPKLAGLSVDFNDISYEEGMFDCLPNLQILRLNKLNLRKIVRDSFVNITNLKYLSLRYLPRTTYMDAYAFNNSKLQKLDIAESRIEMWKNINNDAFKDLPSLTSLFVSHNNFKYATDEQMLQFFGHLQNLRVIEMGYCNLKTVPQFIGNLKNLTNLSLFGNHISNIPDGSFTQLKYLKILNFVDNEISLIKESAISSIIRDNLISISMAENPFDCNCRLQWFVDWTRRKEKLFKWYPGRYNCKSPSSKIGLSLDRVYFSPYTCFLTFPVIASILGTTAVCLFVLVVVSILYKLRWRIRHCFYMKYFHQRLVARDYREYTYDAYIIHSDEDENWVVENMLPHLEDHHYMKLCIPSRDFHPGNYVLNNIDTAIQTSRYIVVVLSSSFVESEWCQTELTMAQSFVLDTGGNPLLAVVLEEPDARNMRHSLHVLLRSTAYIIWGEEEEARQLFWRRLVETLRPDEINLRN